MLDTNIAKQEEIQYDQGLQKLLLRKQETEMFRYHLINFQLSLSFQKLLKAVYIGNSDEKKDSNKFH